LNIDGAFTELVGRPQSLPTKRYPQAIAVALALRHSWRREELVKFARRLGIKRGAKGLLSVTAEEAADASAVGGVATASSDVSVH
jgi:hypothetical protein